MNFTPQMLEELERTLVRYNGVNTAEASIRLRSYGFEVRVILQGPGYGIVEFFRDFGVRTYSRSKPVNNKAMQQAWKRMIDYFESKLAEYLKSLR